MADSGREKHIGRLKKLASDAEIRRVANATVYEGADMIRDHAHFLISRGSASGQSGGKHQHQRSKPGEPPHREFGDLQRGLETDNPKPMVARVISAAPHAGYLEWGTSKMAERPYMRPARDAKVKEIRALFVKRVNQLVERSG